MKSTTKEQVRNRIEMARINAEMSIASLKIDFNLLSPEEVQDKLRMIRKHTDDWQLWAQVYSEMYEA